VKYGLGLSLKVCGLHVLVLVCSLVRGFHSWYRKFEAYRIRAVTMSIHLLFIHLQLLFCSYFLLLMVGIFSLGLRQLDLGLGFTQPGLGLEILIMLQVHGGKGNGEPKEFLWRVLYTQNNNIIISVTDSQIHSQCKRDCQTSAV